MEENKVLDIVKCDKCGNLMRKSLIDYKKEYLSEVINIENIEGYVCQKCGNQTPTEAVMNYVNEVLEVEELKIRAKVLKSMEYLLVNKVKNVRVKKGLSQKELGHFLDSPEQRYGVIERNSNTPTIIVEHLIASYLDVKVTDLYEMVFVPPELYRKLLNLEIINAESNNYEFKHVAKVERVKEEIKEKREQLKQYNSQKRKLKYMLGKGRIEKKDGEMLIKDIDEKIEEIKLVKDDKKNGLEIKLKKLEGKHPMVIKQDRVIDEDTWKKVKKTFNQYF